MHDAYTKRPGIGGERLPDTVVCLRAHVRAAPTCLDGISGGIELSPQRKSKIAEEGFQGIAGDNYVGEFYIAVHDDSIVHVTYGVCNLLDLHKEVNLEYPGSQGISERTKVRCLVSSNSARESLQFLPSGTQGDSKPLNVAPMEQVPRNSKIFGCGTGIWRERHISPSRISS